MTRKTLEDMNPVNPLGEHSGPGWVKSLAPSPSPRWRKAAVSRTHHIHKYLYSVL